MQAFINRERCEGHRQRLAAAPVVLDLNDDGIAVLRTSEPLTHEDPTSWRKSYAAHRGADRTAA